MGQRSIRRRAVVTDASSSPCTTSIASTRQLIVDTDFGFDDILSLLLLDRHSKYNLQLISTVSGVSLASTGAAYARAIFGSSVEVAAGQDVDAHGDHSSHHWLPSYRNRLDRYMASKHNVRAGGQGDQSECIHGNCTAIALRNVLESSVERECDLICLGPLTNVASWLEDPSLAQLMCDKIENVWVLGGTEGSGPDAGEFNFQLDSNAVRSIIQTHHLQGKLRIVTSDVSGPDAPKFDARFGETIGKMAREGAIDDKISHLLRNEPRSIYFDPICAFASIHSDQLRYKRAHVRSVEPNGNISLLSNEEQDEEHKNIPIGGKGQMPSVEFLDHLDDAHRDLFVRWISETGMKK